MLVGQLALHFLPFMCEFLSEGPSKRGKPYIQQIIYLQDLPLYGSHLLSKQLSPDGAIFLTSWISLWRPSGLSANEGFGKQTENLISDWTIQRSVQLPKLCQFSRTQSEGALKNNDYHTNTSKCCSLFHSNRKRPLRSSQTATAAAFTLISFMSANPSSSQLPIPANGQQLKAQF